MIHLAVFIDVSRVHHEEADHVYTPFPPVFVSLVLIICVSLFFGTGDLYFRNPYRFHRYWSQNRSVL